MAKGQKKPQTSSRYQPTDHDLFLALSLLELFPKLSGDYTLPEVIGNARALEQIWFKHQAPGEKSTP